MLGHSRVPPAESLGPSAQTISIRPASRRANQPIISAHSSIGPVPDHARNIGPPTSSGGDVGLDLHRFDDEPERSARIPRPPAIAFRIVSKVAVTSAGI